MPEKQLNTQELDALEKEPLLKECLSNIQKWLAYRDLSEQEKAQTQQLLQSLDIPKIRDHFYRDLEFGTGGMRGVMGIGTNRLNNFVIEQTMHGWALFLKKKFLINTSKIHTELKNNKKIIISVTIGHDSRHNSAEFTKKAAVTLASHGIHVYLFPSIATTPILSFAIRHLHCQGGICITASHNPPEYNGLKIYSHEGAQIVPPDDGTLVKQIQNTVDFPKLLTWDTAQPYIHTIDPSLEDAYGQKVLGLSLNKQRNINMVYTPLHGTGGPAVKSNMGKWGFLSLFVVPEQEKPDGNFPTVKSPNPEEPSAFNMALDYALKRKANIILGNDPDADRMALATEEPQSIQSIFTDQNKGDFIFWNGNQTGVLLLDYLLSHIQIKPTHYMVKTIVTSPLFSKIAKAHNLPCYQTLTGFKWIAHVIEQRPQREFLFGAEESFGYLIQDFVRDKDGVASLCLTAEMCAYHKTKGPTAGTRLLEIFKTFGAHKEALFNFQFPGESGLRKMNQFMQTMMDGGYVQLENLSFKNTQLGKVKTAFDHRKKVFLKGSEDGVVVTDLPPSPVLEMALEGGVRLFLRPSGTEPKLKMYVFTEESVIPSNSGIVSSKDTTKQQWQSDVRLAYGKCAEKIKILESTIKSLI